MNRFEQIQYLNRWLLDEMPEYKEQAAQFPQEPTARTGRF